MAGNVDRVELVDEPQQNDRVEDEHEADQVQNEVCHLLR